MSETGEMSEFGYIMELLAKGKVSNSAGGCVWGPGLGTPSMRVSCGIRPVRSWGDTDWGSGSALRSGAPQLYTMHCGRLFFMSKKGFS